MSKYEQILSARRTWKSYPVEPNEFDYDCLDRILCIGLNMELPVGEWVLQASKGEIPDEDGSHRLLKANCADEAVHYRGFKQFEDSYGIYYNYYDEAERLAQEWAKCADKHHFLKVAGTLETSVFLMTLFTMRFFGTQDFANLSEDVSRDEQRHITTNELMLNEWDDTLFNIPSDLERLRKETLDWVFGDFNIPHLGLDKDWMMHQSYLLITDGYAPDMMDMSDIQTYAPPFEQPNFMQY